MAPDESRVGRDISKPKKPPIFFNFASVSHKCWKEKGHLRINIAHFKSDYWTTYYLTGSETASNAGMI